MSYQVLARKWRPANFTEMVGQDHVLRALINALDEDRLHHAYLFTGTRGVGKTTVARIFAKSLNCETGVTSTPCGVCGACTSIAEGRFIDLIEVDAASRTKVEDTRELLDNVQYAPTQGRFKVYLIDEVHMLSSHSFNALLKTLEEPPPHVKFLLATTDPQKLPVTVLSRCLQFNLKRMPIPIIESHLQYILQQEQVSFDEQALRLLAHGADGSMRDALSLLDQAIAYGGGKLDSTEVQSMLGTVSRDRVIAILRALLANDASALMQEVAKLSEMTPDYQTALADLLVMLHQIALAQHVPDAVDENLLDRAELQAMAEKVSAEDVQLFYQVALISRQDLPMAPDPKTGFEMALLRMLAFKPKPGAQRAAAPVITQSAMPSATPMLQASTEPAALNTAQHVSHAAAPAPVSAQTDGDSEWHNLVQAMNIKGMVKQLAVNCVLKNRETGQVNLMLSQDHSQLLNSGLQSKLQAALSESLGESIKLEVQLGESQTESPAQTQARNKQEKQQIAEQDIERDPMVQSLKDNFGAQVVPNSVRSSD